MQRRDVVWHTVRCTAHGVTHGSGAWRGTLHTVLAQGTQFRHTYGTRCWQRAHGSSTRFQHMYDTHMTHGAGTGHTVLHMVHGSSTCIEHVWHTVLAQDTWFWHTYGTWCWHRAHGSSTRMAHSAGTRCWHRAHGSGTRMAHVSGTGHTILAHGSSTQLRHAYDTQFWHMVPAHGSGTPMTQGCGTRLRHTRRLLRGAWGWWAASRRLSPPAAR